MDRANIRTWAPVIAILAALPVVFALLRALLQPIGHAPVSDAATPPAPAEPHAPGGGGSAACGSCHADEAKAWSSSTHAVAERPIGPDDPLPDGTLDLDGPRGTEAFRPERAIGVAPVVQYLVPLDEGRLQVTQRAWDPGAAEWFDVFGDDRGPGEWGHWTGGGMTWNSQCAYCHSTGVTKGWDPVAERYATTVDEHGVGCTACHGALADHGAGTPVPAVSFDACAACHARRAELGGRLDPSAAFLDQFAPQLVDATEIFYADGQVREEDFEYTAFIGSKMYANGVTCVSCHDPHTGRTRADGDALCLSCHQALPGFSAHDHHPAASAPGCVGCHMPITTYMQRDRRHDHGFVVPDPVGRRPLGIPDPCDRCHTDKGGAWVDRQATEWYGDLDSPRRDRMIAVASGRALDPAAVPALVGTLTAGQATGSAWRASAAAVLGGFVDDPRAWTALVGAAADNDALVRFAAVGALDPIVGDPARPEVERAVAALLDDPVRAVRVQAARAMRFRFSPSDPKVQDYVAYLDANIDVPSGLHERGTWAIERGDWAEAVKDLTRAVALDPNGVGGRDALAVAYAGYGRPEQAAVQLQAAVRLAPDDGGLWYRLGLAEAGRGSLPDAEAALDHAAGLQPDDPRTWYNLGLVRQQLGRGNTALDALARAVALAPGDADTRYALASVAWQQGDHARGRAEARAVLAIAPGHPGATALLAQP